jgi:hypothetical protein
VIDHKATRLLWDLIQIEMETELKKNRQYLKNLRGEDPGDPRFPALSDHGGQSDMTVETVNRTFLKEHGLTYDEVVGNLL